MNPFASPPRSPVRRAATLSLVPIGLLGGYLGSRALRVQHDLPLPPPFPAERGSVTIPFGTLVYHAAGPEEGAPLLLIHSVNAAANAYEVKPLFEHYGRHRPVYALDLPGFGFSDRPDRIYTVRLMTDAVVAMVEAIRKIHGPFAIDTMALSLSTEFLARAATEHPTYFRTIGLVAPTGFDSKRDTEQAPGTTYAMPALRDIVSFPVWSRPLFDALVSKPSMRFFLQKTFGSKTIDEGLFRYDYRSAHQVGAEHAPFSFLSGYLFSADALTLFKALTLPVWMVHGVRGDFVDYTKKREVADRPNWTIQVLRTGAMPHFERLDEMTASYDSFLDKVA